MVKVSELQFDKTQILQLFEDGDRALIATDVAEMRRIYADDYVQHDEMGSMSTRQNLIDKLAAGKIRFLSMRSTGRSIRMLCDDVAIVNGSEEDEIEQEGLHFIARYIYMDIVMKREDRWQIVASQLAKST